MRAHGLRVPDPARPLRPENKRMQGDTRASWFKGCVHPDLADVINHTTRFSGKNMDDPEVACAEIRRTAESHNLTQNNKARRARAQALAAGGCWSCTPPILTKVYSSMTHHSRLGYVGPATTKRRWQPLRNTGSAARLLSMSL